MPVNKSAEKGFTLLELLVSLAVFGVISAGVYTAYQSQQESHATQEQVAVMQQSARAAMYYMEREIRMAGCDPSKTMSGVGFWELKTYTDWDSVRFTMDITDDSGKGPPDRDLDDFGEDVTYELADADGDGDMDLCRFDQFDNDGDGDVDEPDESILARNITALGFAYAIDDDRDGHLDRSAGGGIIWAVDTNDDGLLDRNLDYDENGVIEEQDITAGGTALASSVRPDKIRAVRVWLLTHAEKGTDKFYNHEKYVVGNRIVQPNSNIRMRLLESVITCRNLVL